MVDDLWKIDYNLSVVCNLTGVSLTSTYQGSGILMVEATYDQSLQGQTITVTFRPSFGSPLFATIPDSNRSFVVDPDNNIAADAYDQHNYELVSGFQIISIVLTVLALSCFIVGLFTNKFIGIEMIGVVQLAVIGLLTIG